MKKFSVLLLVVILLIILIGCASAASKAKEISQIPKSENTTTSGGISGIIDNPTKSAIKTTESAINSTEATKAAVTAATTGSITTSVDINESTSQFLIIVNLSTNKLTLQKDNQKIASYDIASGVIENGRSSTPSGKCKVLAGIYNPYWGGGGYAEPIKGGDPKNPLGHYWIGLTLANTDGGDYGIHGNIDEASIGTYASHGCIRMHNDEVKDVYDFSANKPDAWIGTSEELTSWGAINFD